MDTGLRFRRVDLHTHAPASDCFVDKSVSAEEIVQAAIDADIDAIAITDHDTGLWIDKIGFAAEGTQFTVFPGVEVSVSDSCHVAALLDTDKGTDGISDLLVKLDIPRDEWGRTSAPCRQRAYEAIETIADAGGLAILSRIDECKGTFTKLSGLPRQRLFSEAGYHVAETSTGELPSDLSKSRGFRRFATCYQALDNPDPADGKKHSHLGIGKPFSWFKLNVPVTLDGLRECFCDPQVRIRKTDYTDASR